MDQRPQIKKTDVVKRSISINGHKTSVSLENEFWQGLHEIAGHNHAKIVLLVEQIDRARTTCNLSSAIRVFVFKYFRDDKFAAQGTSVRERPLYGDEKHT
jgi:predicted DNA-binding ribbon-helix-helix protein